LRREGVARGDDVGAVGEFGKVEGGEQEQGFGGVPARAEDGEEVGGVLFEGGEGAGLRGCGVEDGEDGEEADL